MSENTLNNLSVNDAAFWDNRWLNNQTGWDIGYPSKPLESYFSRYADKKAKILIPGCGNAYEASFLLQEGFEDIVLLDISEAAVKRVVEKFNSDRIEIINQDFFNHNGEYDVIVEQTFFCAIDPKRRNEYVQKMHDLLAPNGLLIGLLFNKQFAREGPPYGGKETEYIKLFSPLFNIKKMATCYNSILPRQGTELFVILEKKMV